MKTWDYVYIFQVHPWPTQLQNFLSSFDKILFLVAEACWARSVGILPLRIKEQVKFAIKMFPLFRSHLYLVPNKMLLD